MDDVIAIDIQTTSTVPLPVTFDGRAGSDTIIGPKSDATWSVTGADSGTVAGVTFTNVENLQGAADNADTFVFARGGSVSGSVDGGAGGSDAIVLPDGTAFTAAAAQANGIWFHYAGIEGISAGAPAGVAGGGSDGQAVAGAPLNAEAAARAAPDAPSFISAARTERPLVIQGDGSQARDFTHVTDAVEALVALITMPRPPSVVNVGGGAPVRPGAGRARCRDRVPDSRAARRQAGAGGRTAEVDRRWA